MGIVMLEVIKAEDLPKLKNSKDGTLRAEETVLTIAPPYSDANRLGHGPLRSNFLRQKNLSYAGDQTLPKPNLG
jgi:hypothetical protein